jgi:hypothetical protein
MTVEGVIAQPAAAVSTIRLAPTYGKSYQLDYGSVGLVQYVLRDAPEWTREKILAAMNGAQPLTVTLKNRIRVFIVYATAIATEKGNILFFDDIYRHDERLEKALEARRVRSAANLSGERGS